MKINYILTLILVFCIGASIPILTGSSQVNEQHSAKSEVPYCVTPPTVPAHVEMMGFLGMGNNPMVGATVAVAVSIEEAMK